MTVVGFGQWPKSERVQQRYRTGAHREYVPNNAPYARRGSFVWFDGRRMIVRFNFHDDGETISDVDDTSVLGSGSHHQSSVVRREHS